MRSMSGIALACLMVSCGSATAQSCLDELQLFAADVCGEYAAAAGGTTNRSLEVELSGSGTAWLRWLLDIGARAGGQISQESFQNIMREHIAADWQNNRECRVGLITQLVDRICGQPGPPSASPRSAPAQPTQDYPIREAVPIPGPPVPEGLSPQDAEIWTRLMPRPGQSNRAEMCCVYRLGWCTPYGLYPPRQFETADITHSDLFIRCYCFDEPGIVGQNCP